MSRILITIEVEKRRLDAAVPPHLTAVDLLGWIEKTLGSSGDGEDRSLLMPDGSAIDDATCLASAGVLDGMTLRAESLGVGPRPAKVPPPQEPAQVAAIPAPLSMLERALVTSRVLLGRTPPMEGGAWARAVDAWRWTDHDRRLTWLITRARPPRAPIISVYGHRSAEVGEGLALAFASTRPEPVVLVDGDPMGRLSRHLGGSRVPWPALARELADPTLGRLQRDRLFARSSAGLPMIPAAEEGGHHVGVVLNALSQHRSIVIVDEGPSPETAPIGDPAVVSTVGAVPTPPGAINVGWGSQDPGAPNRTPLCVPMDGRTYRMLELAATVAGRWATSESGSDDRELG